MKIVCISGTPGVGKTALAKRLAQILELEHVELSRHVIEKGLYQSFDEERGTYVIDEDAVRSYIRSLYSSIGPFVLDSHYAELAPRDLVELLVVLRLDPRELRKRLAARGWSARKIAENVEAELLSIPTRNAVEELGEELVAEVDATGKSVDELAEEVLAILFGEKPYALGPRIDWMTLIPLSELDELLRFLESVLS